MTLTDPDLFAQGRHHEVFARLRSQDPVSRHHTGDGDGFWALTRYDDVVAAYRDHATFSSAQGAIVGGSFRNGGDSASGDMLVASDLPRHRLLRKQLQPAFGTAMVQRIAAQVEIQVAAALDRIKAAGGCDVATEFAPELPIGALMALLDIGYEDARHVLSLTRRMIGYRDEVYGEAGSGGAGQPVPSPDEERIRLAQVQSEIFGYFAELMEERRSDPGDDLVGLLLRAELNGRPMTDAQVLYNCMNVAVGGNETSSYTACAGVLAFVEHPGEYERLRANPGLLGSALDEVLRWSSTNAYVQRVATRDVEIAGTAIEAGDAITLWNVSANFDETQFEDPHRFDITRSPNHHVSFGSGIHRCIGAIVGNVELSAAFSGLLRSGLEVRLAGPVERLRSNFILGFTTLPVEVR